MLDEIDLLKSYITASTETSKPELVLLDIFSKAIKASARARLISFYSFFCNFIS